MAPPLSAAEKMRRYRERLKQNPDKYEEQRKKNLERIKSRYKYKKISEMTDGEKVSMRNKWKELKQKQKLQRNSKQNPKKPSSSTNTAETFPVQMSPRSPSVDRRTNSPNRKVYSARRPQGHFYKSTAISQDTNIEKKTERNSTMIGPTQQQPQQQKQQPQPQKQQPQQQQQPKQLRVYKNTFDAQPGPSTAVLEEQDDDDDDSDSEESCSTEHEVGIITEPLTGIQDPLANNPDRCRFCANVTKCVDAIDKPYLKNNKMTVILNDINVEIDLADTQKVCLHCDRKLLEMFTFVTIVKNAQDTLLNASYDTEETETLVVKTECESPTPDDNDEIDEEIKEGIVDSITIDETAFVKNDVFIHKKRKCDKDTNKSSKPQKKQKVDDKVTCESTELMIDIKEEPIERDDVAYTNIQESADSKDRDTGPDDKPSELDIATNTLLNEMAGDGVS